MQDYEYIYHLVGVEDNINPHPFFVANLRSNDKFFDFDTISFNRNNIKNLLIISETTFNEDFEKPN